MPFKYAHITWTDSPEAVANQLEKWAGYLLKDAEQLRKNLKQDLYSKPANDQMQIQYENPEGWKDKSTILLDIVDDLEVLQKLREKIQVVELKTPAEEWEEWAVTQRPLYTQEAIQKLPDDMIYLISTYLEDELALTEDVGGRNGVSGFRNIWWKGGVQTEFRLEVESCFERWTNDALKMFWVNNVLQKMTFNHLCDDGFSNWASKETNNYNRTYLARAVVKWTKANLIENFTKLFCITADKKCSFKFQMPNPLDVTTTKYMSVNNYIDNIICNKDMYHLIKTIFWITRMSCYVGRGTTIKKYKNKELKTCCNLNYDITNTGLSYKFTHTEHADKSDKYLRENPTHYRVMYYREGMADLDKVVPRLHPAY